MGLRGNLLEAEDCQEENWVMDDAKWAGFLETDRCGDGGELEKVFICLNYCIYPKYLVTRLFQNLFGLK